MKPLLTCMILAVVLGGCAELGWPSATSEPPPVADPKESAAARQALEDYTAAAIADRVRLQQEQARAQAASSKIIGEVAPITVSAASAFICLSRDALEVAGDEKAKESMGELNYMQVMIRGGCIQVRRGTHLLIRGLSEKNRDGFVISPLGKIGRMRDFSDAYGTPLAQSSLHHACHTDEPPAPPAPPVGWRETLFPEHIVTSSTACGMEY